MNYNAKTFINKYEHLYYDPLTCPNIDNGDVNKKVIEKYKTELNELGINSINGKGTDYYAEQYVVDNLLKCSVFNKVALAWKAGKVLYKDGIIITADSFEKESYYTNGYGGHIPKNEFYEYCKALDKSEIKEMVENGDWKGAYNAVNAKPATNIGVVYNINTLFFLSGGKAPIYDAFAHKAVKALVLGISPSEVYLGENPSKDSVDKIIALYKEYMILLNIVFPDEINISDNNNMYISRELDRALWVYGHANKKYNK